MKDTVFSDYSTDYQFLSKAVAGWMWTQWRWLTAPYWLGMRYSSWEKGRGQPAQAPQSEKGQVSPAPVALETRVLERTGQGLAPPREIYDVQNRSRIDWSKVPEWARPCDPELFEGCQHEG